MLSASGMHNGNGAANDDNGRRRPEIARMDSVGSMASTKSQAMSANQRRCIAVIAVFSHVLSGLSIVLINKRIVHDHGLHMPALVSSTGALFTAAFTRLLVFFGHVQVRPIGKRPWEFALRRALPVGVCAAGSLCFGNMSYIYLDAGLVQMLKAGTPALLLIVLVALRVETVSPWSASLAMVMVTGSFLASVQQPNATILGLAVQLASQLCEVLQCTAMQVFLQQLGFEAWDAGYYLAPAIAACCLLPSLLLEWPHVIANHKVGVLYDQVPLLFASGVVGIVVNFASLLVIKFTSSLLAKLLVIARSAALVLVFIAEGEPFTWLQVVGYVITLTAFAGYSVLKAWEMEHQALQMDSEDEEAEEDFLEPQSPTPSVGGDFSTWDVTSSMFWFAVCVIIAGGYQAMVVGDLPSSCDTFQRALGVAQYRAVSTVGMPPTPYLEPMTAGAPNEHWVTSKDNRSPGKKDGWPISHTAGALNVETAAKALYLDDGRFLLHDGNEVVLGPRTPDKLLSSGWILSSKQFGLVYLSTLDSSGGALWLTCELQLVEDWTEACLLWMAASSWHQWMGEKATREYTFRRHGDMGEFHEGSFLTASHSKLTWSGLASSFNVMDWVPEACPMLRMEPSAQPQDDALGEVTFTMTTYFRVYARSIMFRQALASVFRHLKDADTYLREFLVINDWYAGRSLNWNGTFTGPSVEQTRQEMLSFFPGCHGVDAVTAKDRTPDQKCTFIFKAAEEPGQATSLNLLIDLMKTKYWIHFEDDHVFYQDVYLSRLLAPMYEHPRSCWRRGRLASEDVEEEKDGGETMADQKRRRLLDGAGAEEFDAGAEEGDASRCLTIAGVRMGEKPGSAPVRQDGYETKHYDPPDVLFDDDYIREYLAHGGVDGDEDHDWGNFNSVGAIDWPLFSLRPSLYNLTYIRNLEAPLFCDHGRPGRFCESENLTVWQDDGKVYKFHWNFELEFAVRWARAGGTVATLNPGACMRDISNSISSFERS